MTILRLYNEHDLTAVCFLSIKLWFLEQSLQVAQMVK
jgi:hypothetical protein